MGYFNDIFKKKNKKEHPFHKLNMGLVKEYSMIIPISELGDWTNQGWIEDKKFSDFHYEATKDETIVLNKPKSIKEIDISELVGCRIIEFCSWLGTYGMGGPGFFGLLINLKSGVQEYLVYTVWASGQYILLDNRVIECHLRYNKTHRPWISSWGGESVEEQWDDLTDIIVGSIITQAKLFDCEFILEITKNNIKYNIVYYKNNPQLPPLGNGEVRKDAFVTGNIGDYILFNNKNAVLHV
jgi:hypothetical protein